MKIGIIYTAKTDELEAGLRDEAHRLFGDETEVGTYQDLSVLKDINAAGYAAAAPVARYAGLIAQATADGADAILSTCCFMGDAVDSLQSFAAFTGVPIVSIDEEMCRQAVCECGKVLLLFTAPPAGYSVGHTIERMVQRVGSCTDVKKIHLVDTAGLEPEELAQRCEDAIADSVEGADGVILAQPSMAAAAPYLRQRISQQVYCPTDDGMDGLKRKLVGLA